MKSPIPPAMIMLPQNQDLKSDVMETAHEIAPRCEDLTQTRDVPHIRSESTNPVRSTSPVFFNLTFESPSNFHTSTSVHSVASKKFMTATKPHPYFSHNSFYNRTDNNHSRNPPKQSHRRRSNYRKTEATGNLFLEGFSDCASEVLRFLREVECVEDSNPLLQGLQSHLTKVQHTYCPENISNLNEKDQCIESRVPDIHPTTANHVTSQSPIHKPRQTDFDLTSHSDSKQNINFDYPTTTRSKLHPFQANSANFFSPNRHSQSSTTADYKDNAALGTDWANTGFCSSQINKAPKVDQLYSLSSTPQNKVSFEFSKFLSESLTQPTVTAQSIPCLSSVEFTNKPRLLDNFSHHLNDRHMKSTAPPIAHSFLAEETPLYTKRVVNVSAHEENTTKRLLCTDVTPKTDPVVSWCFEHPALSASSLSMLSSQSLNPTISQNDFQPKLDAAGIISAISTELEQAPSVLELRPNFLPGVASSSVASGNFADVLLAVESCRGHKDSRVRTLAEELIYLIHNDEDTLSDEEDDDIDVSEGVVSDDEIPGEESGIEMDDSWGSAADLIEQ